MSGDVPGPVPIERPQFACHRSKNCSMVSCILAAVSALPIERGRRQVNLRVCYRRTVIPAVEGLVAKGPDSSEEFILTKSKYEQPGNLKTSEH